VRAVSWSGWNAIDLAETDLGRTHDRPRARISDRAVMLRASQGTNPDLGEGRSDNPDLLRPQEV